MAFNLPAQRRTEGLPPVKSLTPRRASLSRGNLEKGHPSWKRLGFEQRSANLRRCPKIEARTAAVLPTLIAVDARAEVIAAPVALLTCLRNRAIDREHVPLPHGNERWLRSESDFAFNILTNTG